MFLRLTIELKCNLWMIVYLQLILYHNPSWSQNHGFKMLIYRFCKHLLASMSFEESQLCKYEYC